MGAQQLHSSTTATAKAKSIRQNKPGESTEQALPQAKNRERALSYCDLTAPHWTLDVKLDGAARALPERPTTETNAVSCDHPSGVPLVREASGIAEAQSNGRDGPRL